MRPILYYTVVVLVALATPASAQRINASSTSTSRSVSAGGAGGNSTSAATGGTSYASGGRSVVINKINTGTGTGTTDPSGDPATDPAADPSASDPPNNTTQTVRNTPELMAPSIVGGNPCTVGATGGIALPGFGIVGGGSWEGKGCERRQLAALMFNMGHDLDGPTKTQMVNAAIEVLCTNDDVRTALKRVGRPCIEDQPPVPVAVVVPAPAPPPVVPVTVPKWTRPDWCDTASPAEQRANSLACFGTPGRTSKPRT